MGLRRGILFPGVADTLYASSPALEMSGCEDDGPARKITRSNMRGSFGRPAGDRARGTSGSSVGMWERERRGGREPQASVRQRPSGNYEDAHVSFSVWV